MEPIRRTVLRPDLMKPPPLPKATPGLGDVVAMVANPIALLMDKTMGSKLVGCQPCGQRRDALNRIIPNVLKPFSS